MTDKRTYVIRHFVVRSGNRKDIRKLIIYGHTNAIQYISELRQHETLILFKECQRKQIRRNK